MKKRHLIIYIVFALLAPLTLQAQDNTSLREVYSQAESEYKIGRLEQAIDLLQTNLNGFQGNLRQSACRLMSLCYLALDDIAQSENYAMLLLRENPYYSSVQDPIRFEEIINRLKMGTSATITTASNQAESLDEAPVPVTLITEDMIRISGARNLKEALIAYVPGMTNVECNEEMNVAMRGVYSSGQEKILIMLNGHRLNSYGTNVGRPDFSISLEKVKQIEVLRGPASSLYGGVALTAVINIITKIGIEMDGLKVKAGAGNYGQLRADVLYGTHYMDLDIAAWASLYNASGEKVNLPMEEQIGAIPYPGDITIGGYNHKPSYDLGATLKWKDFTLMHNTNFSKYVAPYTMSYFFAPYDYKAYRTFDGNLPGYANTAHHTTLGFNKELGQFQLMANVAYDIEDQTRYQTAGCIPAEFGYVVIPPGTTQEVLFTDGLFQYHNWQESNFSTTLRGSYQYNLGNQHHGTLSAGAQYHHFSLDDSYYVEGHEYDQVIVTFGDEKNLRTGTEYSFNAYAQLKHQWRDFIMNLGIRHDFKERSNGMIIKEWSPRLALIYLKSHWNIKVSYSKSFVDAPYFYRNNTLDTTEGGEDLLSEYLHSLQFTLATNNLPRNLNAELNFFYNRATNLVIPALLMYSNAGSMKNIGIELNTSYNTQRFKAYANATWQYVTDFEFYKATDHSVYNIPQFTANVTASYELLKGLEASANVYYAGKQTFHYEMIGDEGLIEEDSNVPSFVRCNLGLTYKFKKAELGFNVHNLFNKRYSQGGTSIGTILQPGRWFMASIAYKL